MSATRNVQQSNPRFNHGPASTGKRVEGDDPLQVHCTIKVEVLPDFTLDDEGSLIILHPVTAAAREWVDAHIGQENGYQPMWPTVVIEHRYADDIITGAQRDGLTVVRQ